MTTPSEIGDLIKRARRQLKLTQKDLALTSGTGLRFIVELEKGKPTCEMGKTLAVIRTLGIALTLTPPDADITMATPRRRSSHGA